jgi:arylsulfatase A-like enzyme
MLRWPIVNIIVIMLDSLRQDHVGAYGKGRVFDGIEPCRTPNLDAFAREAVVFDNAFPMGLPTMPVRTELFTGQATLPFKGWEPLAPAERTVAEILGPEGYTCGLVTDNYHFRAPGMNFHRGFHSYEHIRGQEYDPWRSAAPRRAVDDYCNERYTSQFRGLVARFLANTDGFGREEDWFAPRLADAACAWLRENRSHERCFLWVDSFEPHEPWDPPKRFDTYTDPGYRGKRLILPMGGLAADWASPEEIRHIRGLYAGEVASVDCALGRLFSTLRELGCYEDSVVVVLADHGHPLADHGKFLKGSDRMYGEVLRVPFMVRLPGGRHARRTGAIVQYPDLLPTLLELAGYGSCDAAMHGRSFAAVLRGETDDHRPAAISGYHGGGDRSIRDRRWSYIERPGGQPLTASGRPGGQPDELYDLASDPRETVNLVDRHPEEARRLAGTFGNLFRDAPAHAVKGLQGSYELGSGPPG